MPRRFSVIVLAVLALSFSVFLAWSMAENGRFAEDKALTEARMLNTSISSAWNYIDESQGSINYNSDGSYDFKHIYCSVAGKNIANRITNRSDGYVVRYVRESPRSSTDEPDAFERAALAHFAQTDDGEFYAVEDYGGQSVLRYASLLSITPNTGALKEGMQIGDIAGATSIVIPLAAYQQQASRSALLSLLFFALLTATVLVVMRLGLRHWAERPLAKANADLSRANRELAEANRVQADFLATMSHELRTPLASIIANTDIWERDCDGAGIEQKQTVAEVRRNSQALLAMVNNTIDAAKMDADLFDVAFEETDLVDVVDSAVSMVEALAAKRGVAIERAIAADAPLIQTDPSALRKVLVNLLSNAVAYSGPGDVVTVGVRPCGNAVELSVVDQGCGIRLCDQQLVFERFRQASGSKGGSGLGLYVSRELVRKLGGGIALASAEGQGAAFTVRLPAGKEDGDGRSGR